MSKAHALLVASLGEGWGLTVTEANAMGTPAIVYDVKGLRDSVRHSQTGLIAAENTPKGLAEAMHCFLSEPELQNRLTQGAWEWSHEFSWDNAAFIALQQLANFKEIEVAPIIFKVPPISDRGTNGELSVSERITVLNG